MRFLSSPWDHTDRLIRADSYVASVTTVEELVKLGLRFIGVVKTATKKFPMDYFDYIEIKGRGDYKVLSTLDDDTQRAAMVAFLWVDKHRRYFVGISGGTAQAGPMHRTRWCQFREELNADPDRVELEIPQNKMIKTYYDICADIDRHNRQRQDDLELERIVKTVTWWKRVCMSVFGMIVVATGNFYSEVVHQSEVDKITDAFFTKLAHEMIFNGIDMPELRRR